MRDTWHSLGEETRILLPLEPSPSELFLARFLTADLVDRRQIAVRTQRVARIPAEGRFVVMGQWNSALVREVAEQRGLRGPQGDQHPDRSRTGSDAPGDDPPTDTETREAYTLDIDDRGILITGADDPGAFYGLQSLRQLITTQSDGGVAVPGIRVCDHPRKSFRALRLYFPGREHFAFFKRLVRDFAAFFKYNTLVLEVNAAMRLDRHPELNAGWIEFGRCLNETRRSRPEGPGRQFQDSAHHDTADFAVIEKEEVAGLVAFARQHHMEVIPEIPSLTHTYYLLTRHRELAEITEAEWPDTYCPLEPGALELYFDVLDEYIEVMQPHTVHIGRDEWRMPLGVCPKCRERDHRDLYALCYGADPLDCAPSGTAPVAFFACEWINPRYGKVIIHIRLRGSSDFVDGHGRPITSNAVHLLAVSVVEQQSSAASEYMRHLQNPPGGSSGHNISLRASGRGPIYCACQ